MRSSDSSSGSQNLPNHNNLNTFYFFTYVYIFFYNNRNILDEVAEARGQKSVSALAGKRFWLDWSENVESIVINSYRNAKQSKLVVRLTVVERCPINKTQHCLIAINGRILRSMVRCLVA